MRNWAVAGVVVVLLGGSAWAKNSAEYRTVQEICLFSSFLAPAESPVALQSLDIFGEVGAGYDFLQDFATSFAHEESNILRSARSAILAADRPIKGIYEVSGGDWRSTVPDIGKFVFGAESDWANFTLNGGGDGTADGKMTFGVSSVRALGVERNGIVAGFNVKF